MNEMPSTSKERIIPIQIEGQPEPVNDVPKSVDTWEPDPPQSEDVTFKRTLPMYNIKEKVIIILDTAEDENFTPFWTNTQQKRPIEMFKLAIEMFLRSKQLINKKHEYALAILNENSVIWLVNFTSNITDIINALKKVNVCETEDIFDLNALFDVINQKVTIPELREIDGVNLPPQFIVRAILFYGRSYTLPKLESNKVSEQLLKSPFFTLDVLMTHEQVDDDNNCDKIFNVLQNLDEKGFAYFFSVGRDVRSLLESVGKLLSHPLQRPLQQIANYSLT